MAALLIFWKNDKIREFVSILGVYSQFWGFSNYIHLDLLCFFNGVDPRGFVTMKKHRLGFVPNHPRSKSKTQNMHGRHGSSFWSWRMCSFDVFFLMVKMCQLCCINLFLGGDGVIILCSYSYISIESGFNDSWCENLGKRSPFWRRYPCESKVKRQFKGGLEPKRPMDFSRDVLSTIPRVYGRLMGGLQLDHQCHLFVVLVLRGYVHPILAWLFNSKCSFTGSE